MKIASAFTTSKQELEKAKTSFNNSYAAHYETPWSLKKKSNLFNKIKTMKLAYHLHCVLVIQFGYDVCLFIL